MKGELLKSGLLSEMQKMELNKEEIAKSELMQRKTIYAMNRDSKR